MSVKMIVTITLLISTFINSVSAETSFQLSEPKTTSEVSKEPKTTSTVQDDLEEINEEPLGKRKLLSWTAMWAYDKHGNPTGRGYNRCGKKMPTAPREYYFNKAKYACPPVVTTSTTATPPGFELVASKINFILWVNKEPPGSFKSFKMIKGSDRDNWENDGRPMRSAPLVSTSPNQPGDFRDFYNKNAITLYRKPGTNIYRFEREPGVFLRCQKRAFKGRHKVFWSNNVRGTWHNEWVNWEMYAQNWFVDDKFPSSAALQFRVEGTNVKLKYEYLRGPPPSHLYGSSSGEGTRITSLAPRICHNDPMIFEPVLFYNINTKSVMAPESDTFHPQLIPGAGRENLFSLLTVWWSNSPSTPYWDGGGEQGFANGYFSIRDGKLSDDIGLSGLHLHRAPKYTGEDTWEQFVQIEFRNSTIAKTKNFVKAEHEHKCLIKAKDKEETVSGDLRVARTGYKSKYKYGVFLGKTKDAGGVENEHLDSREWLLYSIPVELFADHSR